MSPHAAVSPYAAGLAGKCPRCGEGALFDGFLKLAPRCAACGLDFAEGDSGDGPAVFVIFLSGFAAVGVLFLARYAFEAPMWASFLAGAAAAALSTFGLLRPFKATLIALQYRHRAGEARLK